MRKHGYLFLSFAAVLAALLLAVCCGRGLISAAAARLPQRSVAYLCTHGESALPYTGAPRTALDKVNSLHALPSSGGDKSQLAQAPKEQKQGMARIFHFDSLFAPTPELVSICPAEVVVRAAASDFTPFYYVKITHKLE